MSELAKLMEEYFPDLYTEMIDVDTEDTFDALAVMKLGDKDGEGVMKVMDSQVQLLWEVMRQGTQGMDLGMLILSSLYTSMILGVYLGESMKARVTLTEQYHKEN